MPDIEQRPQEGETHLTLKIKMRLGLDYDGMLDVVYHAKKNPDQYTLSKQRLIKLIRAAIEKKMSQQQYQTISLAMLCLKLGIKCPPERADETVKLGACVILNKKTYKFKAVRADVDVMNFSTRQDYWTDELNFKKNNNGLVRDELSRFAEELDSSVNKQNSNISFHFDPRTTASPLEESGGGIDVMKDNEYFCSIHEDSKLVMTLLMAYYPYQGDDCGSSPDAVLLFDDLYRDIFQQNYPDDKLHCSLAFLRRCRAMLPKDCEIIPYWFDSAPNQYRADLVKQTVDGSKLKSVIGSGHPLWSEFYSSTMLKAVRQLAERSRIPNFRMVVPEVFYALMEVLAQRIQEESSGLAVENFLNQLEQEQQNIDECVADLVLGSSNFAYNDEALLRSFRNRTVAVSTNGEISLRSVKDGATPVEEILCRWVEIVTCATQPSWLSTWIHWGGSLLQNGAEQKWGLPVLAVMLAIPLVGASDCVSILSQAAENATSWMACGGSP